MRLFSLVTTLCLVSLAWAAHAASTKKAPAKKSSTAAKTTTHKTTSKKNASSKKAPAKRATTWRNRQMVPTPERYRQIQEALAAKGYLQMEDATGVWSQTSVNALKRFQADQKIESTGKINSLSLIALGLGPKRDPLIKAPAPAPTDQ